LIRGWRVALRAPVRQTHSTPSKQVAFSTFIVPPNLTSTAFRKNQGIRKKSGNLLSEKNQRKKEEIWLKILEFPRKKSNVTN